MQWAEWFERDERRVVGHNNFLLGKTRITISTVFLGIDHSHGFGPPLLWETMILGLPGHHSWRYRSREEAVTMHEQLVGELTRGRLG